MQDFSTWLCETLKKNTFRIAFANHAPAPPSWRLEHRTIDTFHMVFIRRGRGEYVLPDVTVPLEPGVFLLVCPGITHSGSMDSARPLHFSTARFTLHPCARPVQTVTIASPFFVQHHVRDMGGVSELFQELNEHYRAVDTPLHAMICTRILEHVLGKIALEMESEFVEDDFIEQTRQYIQNHPEKRLSVPELARMAHMSSKHFTIRFCEQTGLPPNRYHIMMRCQKAQELLVETHMTIKEIAYALGYPNPYVFSLQFSRHMGCSPSAYRVASR